MSRRISVPEEEVIDEIGKYLGFRMWNYRDKSKKYIFPGNRGDEDVDCLLADDYVEGQVLTYNEIPLLLFQYKGYSPLQALYTLNLITLRPTKASKLQTQIPRELIKKIKASRIEVFV